MVSRIRTLMGLFKMRKSKLNKYFDKIYCVHINSRKDREEHIEENVKKKFNIKLEYFDAYTPEDIDMPQNIGRLNPYEYACAYTHIKLWEKIIEDGTKRPLILEDDVYFDENLEGRFLINKIPDSDMLYLGINYLNGSLTEYNKDFSRVVKGLTTHAYSPSLEFLKKMHKVVNIDTLNTHKIQIDNFMNLMFEGNNVFVYNEPLALQIDGVSDIQQRHTNYHRYLKNSKIQELINFEDVTFVIPAKYDTDDRIDNIRTVILYLIEHFSTNILVVENSSNNKIQEGIHDLLGYPNINYMHIESQDGLFHKMKCVNDGVKSIDTNFFAIQDSDIILPIEQYKGTLDLLRNKRTDMCLPYTSSTYTVSKEDRDKILQTGNINWLTPEMCENLCPTGVAQGGLLFCDRAIFLKMGMGNENFKSWGPEDQELVHRGKKLGVRCNRFNGPIYHLEHARCTDSSDTHPHIRQNEEEFRKIKNMSMKDLVGYVRTWRWLKRG